MKLDSKTLPQQNYFFDITFQKKIITLGSCFSNNIGSKLMDLKFNVVQNPFGTLYHPLVIAQIINDTILDIETSNHHYIKNDGLWRWWLGHGSLAQPDLDTLKTTVDHVKSQLRKTLLDENAVIFLTFGSSFSYIYLEEDLMVGNCHKIPDIQFSKTRSTVSDITTTYIDLISKLIEVNQHIKIVFTVSPVRHIKEGLHENNLSKSTLLLAVDKIISCFAQNCHYFPAYELQIDGLRDYQYYGDDMVHPSPKATAFIWDYFCTAFLNTEMQKWRKDYESLARSLGHKPLHPSSDSFKIFVQNLSSSLENLKNSYPALDWSNELRIMDNIMKQLP